MIEIRNLPQALASGNFIVTLHARQRMTQRSVSEFDIIECGRTAVAVKKLENEKYRVTGNDLDGDELEVICAIDGDIIIVTVY